MSLEKQIRRNRNVRQKVERIVRQECLEKGIKQTVNYNMFVNGKNTGEIVMLPERLKDQICETISNQLKYTVSLSHRNMYVALDN